jgi:hypothetical protein
VVVVPPQAVDLLLEFGANTMVLDRKGRTPAEDTSDPNIRAAILKARHVQNSEHIDYSQLVA